MTLYGSRSENSEVLASVGAPAKGDKVDLDSMEHENKTRPLINGALSASIALGVQLQTV